VVNRCSRTAADPGVIHGGSRDSEAKRRKGDCESRQGGVDTHGDLRIRMHLLVNDLMRDPLQIGNGEKW
jgi:hypothetical protein